MGPGCLGFHFGSHQPPQPQTATPHSDLYSSVIDNETDTFTASAPSKQPNHGTDMTNLTTAFDALLKRHEAAPTKSFSLDTADEFLKEAHRIVRAFPCPSYSYVWPHLGYLTDYLIDPLRPRTPILRACTAICAICVRHTSRPPLHERRTCAPLHPARHLHNMSPSRTETVRKSTPTQR